MVSFLLSLAIAVAVATVFHRQARKFVRGRLRYVDVIQRAAAPWVAGAATFGLTALFTALPFVGLGTALTAGLAVGSGVAAGVRDIRGGSSAAVYRS